MEIVYQSHTHWHN